MLFMIIENNGKILLTKVKNEDRAKMIILS